MSELYIPTPAAKLDPKTLEPLRASWRLPERRQSRYLRLDDALATPGASRTSPPGAWVERAETHPTSGRLLHWRERSIAPGTLERHYLNPAISER